MQERLREEAQKRHCGYHWQPRQAFARLRCFRGRAWLWIIFGHSLLLASRYSSGIAPYLSIGSDKFRGR